MTSNGLRQPTQQFQAKRPAIQTDEGSCIRHVYRAAGKGRHHDEILPTDDFQSGIRNLCARNCRAKRRRFAYGPVYWAGINYLPRLARVGDIAGSAVALTALSRHDRCGRICPAALMPGRLRRDS